MPGTKLTSLKSSEVNSQGHRWTSEEIIWYTLRYIYSQHYSKVTLRNTMHDLFITSSKEGCNRVMRKYDYNTFIQGELYSINIEQSRSHRRHKFLYFLPETSGFSAYRCRWRSSPWPPALEMCSLHSLWSNKRWRQATWPNIWQGINLFSNFLSLNSALVISSREAQTHLSTAGNLHYNNIRGSLLSSIW